MSHIESVALELFTMMIFGVFFVSLLTYVCSDYVPYVESVAAIEGATQELQDRLMSMQAEIPNITDSRRHYSVLVVHIGRVAYTIKTMVGAIYNLTYIDEMPESIVTGLMQVDAVIGTANDFLYKIDQRTQKIQALVDRLCPIPSIPMVCNQLVDQAVKGDPVRYQEEVDIMLLAGNTATALLEADLPAVAEEFEEVAYLINHVDELQDLILNVSDLVDRIGE